jgi:tetratricopeptide (TPR) repeat protein
VLSPHDATSGMNVARITPETASSTRERAFEAFRRGEWPAALEDLDRALEADREDTQLLNLKARAFEALGRHEEALQCVDRCLKHDPRNVADLRNRALVLTKLARRKEALASFEAALALDPNHVDILIKRAHLLHQLDRREDALASAERAVLVEPANLHALNMRGMIFESLCRYDDARVDFERALTLNPQFADAINNRGMIYARQGEFEKALDHYERSLAIIPDQPQALYNRAMVRLALGDWTRGFREFESRWNIAAHEASRFTRLAPVWLGNESVRAKTILLHHEQGYGDSIQFVRYALLVKRLGAQVILAMPSGLRALMQSLPGNSRVVSEGDPIPAHDYCCPLMSLPMVFGTTPETAPAQIPYLYATPDRVRSWSSRLGARTRPRIGLTWSGRRYAPINHPRDMSLETLRPLFALDAQLVCLQTEIGDQDRTLLKNLPQIACYSAELTDFAETAALIQNLDLVICVDTAVAHLAGALGKPVWLMNRYASCWRWLQERRDSPWYPTLRLFRQPAVGDWVSVVRAVSAAAETFVAGCAKARNFAARASEPCDVVPPSTVAESLRAALACHQEGKLPEAISAYQGVLAVDADQIDALHYLGVALAQLGRNEEALVPLARALELKPRDTAAHNHMGNALIGLARYDEALRSYERALALDPRLSDAHYNRGVALHKLDRLSDALASYDQALTLNPAYTAAYNNRGNVLLELGQRAEALGSYARATALRPDFVDAWINRANLLRALHDYDAAQACSERALECGPTHAEAHSSRGAILANLGRLDEALGCYQRAIELDPCLAEGLWNKALAHLTRGEMKQAWPLYESRWRVKSLGLTHRCGPQPPWLGTESLQGRTILLHAEQGYGDSIQFCRYAPLVKDLGARVILGVPEALRSLMGTLEGVDSVIARGALPSFDLHCPLLSLPHALSTELGTIPAPEAYLRADPKALSRWRARFANRKGMRIGVAWSGKPTHTNDFNRSIALAELQPLLERRAQWVSLQKEVRDADRPTLAMLPNLLPWGEELSDFADAAALISALDLIITVDTSIAHLAGALGKPVWVLLPLVADWRWLQDREDSPWYPSARLFRQKKARDWAGVIERVRVALPTFTPRAKSPRPPR